MPYHCFCSFLEHLFLIFGDIGSQPCQLNLNSDKGNSFCLGIVMTHQKSCVHYEGPS